MKGICLMLVVFMLYLPVEAQEWKQLADSGKHYAGKQDLDKATDFYDKAKLILERDSLWTMEHALFCQTYGFFFRSRGYTEEAEPYYVEARQIAEKIGGKNIFYTKTCNNMGLLYMQMGRHSKAEKLFFEARDLNEKLEGKNQSYGLSCNNLGLLYHSLKEYQKAEQFFSISHDVFKTVSGPESSFYLSSTNNLGNVNKLIGQYGKAIVLLKECVATIEKVKGKTQTEYANFSGNLAAAYLAVKNYKDAEYYFLESKTAWEKTVGKQHAFFANALNNLGALYRSMGNLELAKDYYSQAEKIMEEGMEVGDIYATICNNLGELYLATDKARAIALLRKSFQIRQDYGIVNEDHIANCDHIGDYYADNNQVDSAIKYYLLGYQSQLESRQSVFAFTSEAEKKTYMETIDHFYDKLVSLAIREKMRIPGFDLYDYILVNRSLLLQSVLQMREQIQQLGDQDIARNYDEWVENKEELYYWLTKPISDRQGKDSLLAAKANDLEKLLVKYASGFSKLSNNLSFKSVQQGLGQDEAAIEFSSFHYYDGSRKTDSVYYYALVLRKDQAEPVLVSLFEKDMLDKALIYKSTSAGQHQLSYLYNYQPTNKTRNLYDLIWQPLEKHLTGIKKVNYSPGGQLYKISFSALSVKPGIYLSDNYELARLNTTGDLQAVNAAEKEGLPKSLYLFGAVQYDADSVSLKQAALAYSNKSLVSRSLPQDLNRDGVDYFRFLKGSEKEINSISQSAVKIKFDVRLWRGAQATEETFKELGGQSSPGILHLATHGFFFPDPKRDKASRYSAGKIFLEADDPLIRSGLALAGANHAWKGKAIEGVQDGILTAYEVANMYLPNTKLAILSACETGLGDISGSEGVYGLQRAFKIAGVQNLVMSLWKVPDMEASEFMIIFYTSFFNNNSITAAFLEAQATMKKKYRLDPYKWAAWILVR